MKKKLAFFFPIIIFVFLIPLAKLIGLSHEKDTIYIYNDEGVSKESLQHTLASFKKLIKNYKITTINAQQVKDSSWTKNAALFIMPGGADLPYVKKLNGKGNEIINKYVINGGSFLGICAGSYYSSSYVEFDKGGELEVLGSRELNFFKGKAVGPILAPYDYKTQSGSRAAKIYPINPDLLENVTKTVVFYNGGGFFAEAEKYENTTVIARYENKLPAIILIKHGKGKAILSGVHFEYQPYLLDSKDFYIKKIIDELDNNNDSREILFINLMKLIGIE